MQARTVERIEEWGTRSFPGGVEGLRDLADAGFSGAVDAGPWVFVLNGRVIGVLEGRLDDVGPGTAYVAPHDSLPLLFVMLERGGERRGEYYTGETPIEEVDATLREGGFTGYLELSENVLSGDYYLVYHGGERRACAYIGQAERLEAGEEAYQRAVDEVGIYTVTAVDVGVVDLPGGTADAAPTPAPETEEPTGVADGESAGDVRERSTEAAGSSDRDPVAGGLDATGRTDDTGTGTDPESTAGASADPGGRASGEDPLTSDSFPGTGDATTPEPDTDTAPSPAPSPYRADLRAAVRPATGAPPSTPATSDAEGRDATGVDTDAETGAGTGAMASDDDGATTAPEAGSDDPLSGADADPSPGASRSVDARTATAPSETGELTAEADRLREERDELATENERLHEELASVRAAREDLQSEVRRLEERVRDLEADPGTERSLALGPEEALAGTSLFVRYDDRSVATLSEALAGDSDPDAVRENLSLEHHTTFDDDDAAVDDRPFEAFLEETLEYEVAAWLVNQLPYEIRETGHVDDLGALYEALPEIDRIEFRGSVEAGAENVAFDVVCRDRLGTPLVVVDLHDSRDPAGEAEMEALLESAGAVAEATGSVAGAVLVTASFFDPPALETASAATDDGGLLGGSRASFVRLSRRAGYHLCLVEARDRRFHVAMPEL